MSFIFPLLLPLIPMSITGAENLYTPTRFVFDGAIYAVLHGDVDRDGDEDLVVIQGSDVTDARNCTLNFIQQVQPGGFDFEHRQTFLLPGTGALYDLADVSGGPELELVELRRDGVFEYSLRGAAFSSEPSVVIVPPQPPDIASGLTSRAWDFGWSLLSGHKDCIAIPYTDHTDLWVIDDSGRGALGSVLPCGALGGSSELTFDLPNPHEPPTTATVDLFLRSGKRWYGLRRSSPAQIDFQLRVTFEDERAGRQFLSMGARFESGTLVRDLNHDGAVDVARWANSGGVSQPSCRIGIYFGPFNQALPAKPHAEVGVEGVVGYPAFAELNGDSRDDLLICAVEVGTLSMAKTFVMKRLSAYLLAYRQRPDNSFSVAPDGRLKFDYRLDLDSHDPGGNPMFWVAGDILGHGFEAVCVQSGSDRLEIHQATTGELLPEKSARADCPEACTSVVVDLNADGHPDMLLCHPAEGGKQSLSILIAP